MEEINKEISNVVKYQNVLKSTLNKCNQMLIKNDDSGQDRQDKIINMKQETFVNNKLFDSVIEYIMKNTKMKHLSFEENTSIYALQTYGKFDTKDDGTIEIPTISLKSLDKIKDINNESYKINIKWETSNECDNFKIRYKKSDNNEEKKEKEDINNEWNIAKHEAIKSWDNKKQHQVNVNNVFEYDINYKVDISMKVINPIRMIIKSNVLHLKIKKPEIKEPIGDIISIPLQVQSHKGHFSSEHPSNLLDPDHIKHYFSAFNNSFQSGENDWIIFSSQILNLPKTLRIKQQDTYYGQAVKSMSISIGDGNEWFTFKPNIINLHNNNLDEQSFNIFGVDYKMIKQKSLKLIKLQFIQNYGQTYPTNCRFGLSRFELFGIKY